MSGPKCVKLSVEQLAAIEEMNKKSIKREINKTSNAIGLRLNELLACKFKDNEEIKHIIEKISSLSLAACATVKSAGSCEVLNELRKILAESDKLKKEFETENKKIISFLLKFREELFNKINEIECLKKLLLEVESNTFGAVPSEIKSKVISKFKDSIYNIVIPTISDFTFSCEAYDKNLVLKEQIFEADLRFSKTKIDIIEFINAEIKAYAGKILNGDQILCVKSLKQFLEQNKTLNSADEHKFINKIEALLADVVILKNSDEYFEILKKYDNIKNEPDPRRRFMLYDDFIVLCDSVISNAKKMAKFLNELSGLKNQLVSLNSSECAELTAELECIERSNKIVPIDELKAKINAAVNRHLKNEKNKFCGQVIKNAFSELGYECEVDFETIMIKNQKAHIHKPAFKNYLVEVASNSETGMMQVEIVRAAESADKIAPSQELRDIEVETEFCEDYDKVLNILKEKGITVIEKMRKKPGEVKIKKIQVSKFSRNLNKDNGLIAAKKNNE